MAVPETRAIDLWGRSSVENRFFTSMCAEGMVATGYVWDVAWDAAWISSAGTAGILHRNVFEQVWEIERGTRMIGEETIGVIECDQLWMLLLWVELEADELNLCDEYDQPITFPTYPVILEPC